MSKAPVKGFEKIMEKAWQKFRRGQFEDSLSLFDEILDESENAEARYGRACSLFRSEDYEASLADLNALLKQNSTDLRTLHTRALLFGAEENYQDCIADLEKLLEMDPRQAEALCDLGGAYLMNKNYRQAADCFERSIDLDKTCPQAWFGKGASALENKEYKKAIEFLGIALKLDPKHILALLARAEALFLTGQASEARKDIKKLVSIQPDLFKAAGDDLLSSDEEESDIDSDEDIDEDTDLNSF